MSTLNLADARALRAQLAAGTVRPQDAVEASLAVIAGRNGELGAFLETYADRARTRAAELAQRGPEGLPLYGVPVAVKDNLCLAGQTVTCASKILAGFVPPYTATVLEKIEAAGGILIGRTNMDEFAMGSSTENSSVKPARNPHDPARIPGGSSGGSAVAVAAGMAPLALGSDTGGSIRQPAALCGCVGVKPTYGRVSRYGLIAFASSLDQIGPFAATVRDAALLLEVIGGYDQRDSTSLNQPVPALVAACDRGVAGMTVGVPKEYFIAGIQPDVEQAVRAAIVAVERAGAKVVEISLPHTEYAVAVYYLVATAEASTNLARYDGVQYGLRVDGDSLIDMYGRTRGAGFGPEVKRRIMLGTFALASGYYDAYYKKAGQVRRLIKQDFDAAFAQCQAIITPTTPTTAFKLGEKLDDPLQMYLSDIFTISTNLAGIPGMSVPCGRDAAGLPIGAQVLAPACDEAAMFAAAAAIEAGCAS